MKGLIVGILVLVSSCNLFGQGAFSDKGVGHYWTKEGKKVEGEFKVSYKTHLAGKTVVKHYINGKKSGRVNLYDLQSLVMDNDSFIIGYNFTLDSWASYDFDLLKVEKVGSIILYSHCRKVKQSVGNSIPISYLVCSYIVKKEGSEFFNGIATKSQFETLFVPLIHEDEELKQKILGIKKRDWLDNLPALVQEYNERH